MNIYELSGEQQALNDEMEEWAEEHDGDITDFPLEEKLADVTGLKNEQLLSYGVWHKNLMADIDELEGQQKPFKKEVKALQSRINRCQGKADYAKYILQTFAKQGEKIANLECALSWRKNTSVLIPKDVTPELLKESQPLEDFTKTTHDFKKREIAAFIRESGDIDVLIPENDLMDVKKHMEKIIIPDHKNIQIK